MSRIIPVNDGPVPGITEKKRKKPTRLSDRSRDYLKEQGYLVAFVERSYEIKKRVNGVPTGETYWQKFDAFNIADLLAVKPGEPGTLYLQTTDHTNASKHKLTILGESATRAILQCGNRVHLHVWKKRTVQKRELWQVQILDCQIGNRGELYFRELGEEKLFASGTGSMPLFESASPSFDSDPDF